MRRRSRAACRAVASDDPCLNEWKESGPRDDRRDASPRDHHRAAIRAVPRPGPGHDGRAPAPGLRRGLAAVAGSGSGAGRTSATSWRTTRAASSGVDADVLDGPGRRAARTAGWSRRRSRWFGSAAPTTSTRRSSSFATRRRGVVHGRADRAEGRARSTGRHRSSRRRTRVPSGAGSGSSGSVTAG